MPSGRPDVYVPSWRPFFLAMAIATKCMVKAQQAKELHTSRIQSMCASFPLPPSSPVVSHLSHSPSSSGWDQLPFGTAANLLLHGSWENPHITDKDLGQDLMNAGTKVSVQTIRRTLNSVSWPKRTLKVDLNMQEIVLLSSGSLFNEMVRLNWNSLDPW